MVIDHVCPNCKRNGKVWVPKGAKNTIVKCPSCNEREDVKYLHDHLYNSMNIEQYERKELERLKEKYE